MPEYSVWSSPECPLSVEYSTQVFEEIRQKAVDGLVALRRTGLGIGGLLLGEKPRAGTKTLRVHAFEEIECSHAMGPGFLLTAEEFAKLRQRLSSENSLAVVGVFITKPRGDLDLSEQQQAIVSELFQKPDQVILVMRPGSLEPCRSAFYFWNGTVLTQAPEWELYPWRGEKHSATAEAVAEDLPAYPVAKAANAAAEQQNPAQQQREEPVPQKPVAQMVEPAKPASPNFVPVPISAQFKPGPIKPGPIKPLSIKPEPVPLVVPPEPVPTPKTAAPSFVPEPAFAPQPIKVNFDPVEVAPKVTALATLMAFMEEKVFLPIRRNSRKILIWTFSILFVVAAAYGIYASRPLWVTPPPANLSATDSHGILTYHWNPEAAEFVDAGTLSILDDGRNKTIALTHEELMRGSMRYSRNSARVSASLALDERRFICLFEAPLPGQK